MNVATPKTIADLEKENTLHEAFSEDQKTDGVKIDSLHITQEEKSENDTQVDFSDTSTEKVKEDPELHYWRWFLRLVTVTRVSILIGILAFIIYQYSYQSSIPQDDNNKIQAYVDSLHNWYKTFIGYFGWAKTYRQFNSTSLLWSNADEALSNLHNASLNFIDKRYITQQALSTLLGRYQQQHEALETAQQDIAQYGFLPQELVRVFQESDVQVSLQRWLVALESIKFSTAIQVFSYLDTFIAEFASYMWVERDYVKEQMQYVADRGDQDIYAFLSNCYMNPYELSYDCNIIGDFDLRYTTQTDSEVDPNFLKALLYYIDQKLEQTELPSFNIVFQRFDPRAETITFSIEVNTFQQDEAALVQAGIINPHIFIVTNVIHLLKENRFIQWSAIDTKQINIKPKLVRIGSNEFVVNNSTLQYTLPLQQDVAREIYDFQSQQ